MGKLSLLLVLSAMLTSGFLFANVQKNTHRADQRVWDNQQHVLARDAASTGMNTALRQMAQNINGNWQTLAPSLEQDAVSHNGGSYTVETVANGGCSVLNEAQMGQARLRYSLPPSSNADILEVRSTGSYGGNGANGARRHQLVGCFLQADWNDPMPPAFLYAVISQGTFTFNGGVEVITAGDLDGYGNVHTNSNMRLGPQVTIEGHVTYTGGHSIHGSTEVVSHSEGPEVPLTAFDPNVFRTANSLPSSGSASLTNGEFRYDGGNVNISGNVTIRDPDNPADRNVNNPYIWFVNGDLNIGNNSHLTLPDHTIVVVTGEINISGNASVTVTGTEPPRNATPAQYDAWVNQQLHEGAPPIAWYGNRDVTLGGQGSVVGNFYTNGNFTLNGGGQGGNLIGSMAAVGTITANGGGGGTNLIYAQIGDNKVIPGVLLPGKQIVRIGLAEWTGPVLDYADTL